MSLQSPFNRVEDLLAFCSFRTGAGGPSDTGDMLKQSAIEATFAMSQLQNELQRARNYIGKRTGGTANDEYDEYRKAELTEAELYLATSRLYERYAEKIASKFPESNLAGVGDITQGADTPDPLAKMESWHRIAKAYMRQGLVLLYGQPFAIDVGTANAPNNHYPSLTNNSIYINARCCDYYYHQ